MICPQHYKTIATFQMTIAQRFLFALTSLASFTASAGASGIVPHRAVYDLKSDVQDRRSGILSAEGRLAYEITGSDCEGWSTIYRFASRFARAEGTTELSDTRVTAWEAGDGSQLEMKEKQFVNQALREETSLSARKPADSEASVRMTSPTDVTSKLPPDVLFSVAFQKHMLAQAAAGETRDAATVFEGSDGDKAQRAVTLIGPTALDKAALSPVKDVPAMRGMKAWPFSVGYYTTGGDNSELPVYQSSFVMFENGVSSEMTFDYGDYQLKGNLVNLEMLPEGKCP
jgi:hypothetical protein